VPVETVTEVHRLPTPKASLMEMGDAERRLVLVLGDAHNQIATLQRLLLFSLHHPLPDDVSDRISSGRANVVLRLLAATVWETHELISKRVQSDKDGAKYLSLMMDGGTKSYSILRKERGSEAGEILAALRNSHGFHFPDHKAIDDALAELPDAEPLEIYLSQNGDASWFQVSDIVSVVAATRVVKSGDLGERISKIADTIIQHSGELTRFIQHYTGTIFEHASEVLKAELATVEIPAADSESVFIPPVSIRSVRSQKS
jgi:hypothetical protein